jgi:hypothetical protein
MIISTLGDSLREGSVGACLSKQSALNNHAKIVKLMSSVMELDPIGRVTLEKAADIYKETIEAEGPPLIQLLNAVKKTVKEGLFAYVSPQSVVRDFGTHGSITNN